MTEAKRCVGIDIRRRQILRSFAILIPTLALAAPAALAEGDEQIRIMYVPAFTGHLPVLVAEDAGFFKKNGLKVDLLGSNDAIKPLLSGDVDISLPAPSVAEVAAVQGASLKIVMSIQARITQALLVQPELAKTLKSAPGDYRAVVKELAGKKIGISVRGGSVDINLRFLITAAGMIPDRDIYVVPLGSGGAMVAAMKGKQVDAVLGFPPLTQQMIKDGIGVKVLDLAKEGPDALIQPFVVATVLDRFLQQRPETARRFVTAMVQTINFIRADANRAEVKRIVAARLSGLDPELLDGIVAELVATMDPTFTREELSRVNEVQRALGILARDVTPEEIMAEKFIPRSQ